MWFHCFSHWAMFEIVVNRDNAHENKKKKIKFKKNDDNNNKTILNQSGLRT